MSKIVGIDYANGGKAAVYVKSVDGTQKFVIERHGRWMKDNDGDEYCSVCSRYMPIREVTGDPSATNYCPNCGARMVNNYD
jgi:predicted RNA-binding Zn-ribbon protein involved in translation (DUF1610 family)